MSRLILQATCHESRSTTMQNNDGNNASNNNPPILRNEQQPDETRDPNGEVAAYNDNTGNTTRNTTAYLKYFNVVQPVKLSVFSDHKIYDESKTTVSTKSPLSSNPVSGTVDAKNGKNFFAGKTNMNNKKSGQYHSYRQMQWNNKKYPNKYRKNKNNFSASCNRGFNEFISANNVHDTPIENCQPGSINDYACTEPALNQNDSTNKIFLDNHENSEYDSECESDPGDLEKMSMMTAADFNDDRYARYGIHESEIKDYVRTITYKNCIEYCSKGYIKVNINYIISIKLLIWFLKYISTIFKTNYYYFVFLIML